MLSAQIVAAIAVVAALVILFRIQRGSNEGEKTRALVVLGAALIFLIYTLMRGH
jgi:ABC-type Co2+ transport system permease subunit